MAEEKQKTPQEPTDQNPAPVSKKLDLSSVMFRKRNMLAPEVIIESASYIAETSTLGAKLIQDASTAIHLNTTTPDYLTMMEIEGNTEDLLGLPTTTPDTSTVPVRWSSTTKALIDLKHVLMLRRFPLPERSRAHVSLSLENIPGVGPAIRFHFGKAQVEPIRERSMKEQLPAAGAADGNPSGAEPTDI